MSFNPCNIVLLCCCLDTVKIFDKKALGDDGVTLLVFTGFMASHSAVQFDYFQPPIV